MTPYISSVWPENNSNASFWSSVAGALMLVADVFTLGCLWGIFIVVLFFFLWVLCQSFEVPDSEQSFLDTFLFSFLHHNDSKHFQAMWKKNELTSVVNRFLLKRDFSSEKWSRERAWEGTTREALGLQLTITAILLTNRSVVWTVKCQKMVQNVDQCFPKPTMTSSTQTYSVYCHRGFDKPENIHM